jgi:hypothetical protein
MGSAFLFPARLILLSAGPEEAKNLSGESPSPDSRMAFSDAECEKSRQSVKPIRRKGTAPISSSQKRSQLFIRVHNETLSTNALNFLGF